MYVVIFKAKINKLDVDYLTMAKRMRELALNEYGCIEFTAVTEGSDEIAISYWESMAQIKQWKENSEHLVAQKLGRKIWYKDYSVEIMKVLSQYDKASSHLKSLKE